MGGGGNEQSGGEELIISWSTGRPELTAHLCERSSSSQSSASWRGKSSRPIRALVTVCFSWWVLKHRPEVQVHPGGGVGVGVSASSKTR